eukprot:6822388-Karenia_brevis.AAC.1
MKAEERKFEMPTKPEEGDHKVWAAIDMLILNKFRNMKDQAEALEHTIPQKLRLEWMATCFVWGTQRVCSDKAIR